MRCNRYELREEGASAGKWRGGIGIVRTWEFLTDSLFTGEGDRHTDPPRGVFGGQDGLTGSMTLNPNTDGEQNLHAKLTNYKIRKGDLLEIRTPCAGGYGNPNERDPQMVLDDILDDFISKETVKEVYKVVIRNDFTIDEEATKQLRKGLEVLNS
ncbi:N-methylhydantoinase B/oxoprolinase/acetone carboxylase alpha subunit [Peribacillus sp. B2I2]